MTASVAKRTPSRIHTSTGAIVVGDLKDRMEREMKEALQAGEKLRLGALRMLAAAVKNREVELRHELSDEEFVEVAQRQVKKHKESAEEVAALVDEAMVATGATDPGDLGKVMGYVMGKAKGRVDGGTVNRLVRERLAG